MHLSSEELVDIAEGTRPETAAPHLASCDVCRAQVNDLRSMMSAVQSIDVSEPSPLFWDHLSSRVRDAIAAEAAPRRAWLDLALWRRAAWDPMSVVAVAAIVMMVVVKSLVTAPVPTALAPAASIADAGAATELLSDVASGDDASLWVVASLTDDVDLETVREAGLAPRGSAEHAVTHMSESELRELGRLLKEELTRPGA